VSLNIKQMYANKWYTSVCGVDRQTIVKQHRVITLYQVRDIVDTITRSRSF